jgi:hypothetical protein
VPWLVRFAVAFCAFSLTSFHSVVQYDPLKGHLLLEHAFPKTAQSKYQVWVDVNLVLENIDSQALRDGTWVNVIGYTRHTTSPSAGKDLVDQNSGKGITLQAILIWDAGPLRVNDYTSTLEEQRLAQRQFKAQHNKDERG